MKNFQISLSWENDQVQRPDFSCMLSVKELSSILESYFLLYVCKVNLRKTFLIMLEDRIDLLILSHTGSIGERLVITEKENFADSSLALGPRYQPKDIKLSWALDLHKEISGKGRKVWM